MYVNHCELENAGKTWLFCSSSSKMLHFVSATFHLLGPEHQVDPGWPGLSLHGHVPLDFLRPVLPLFRQSRQPAAQTSLSAGTNTHWDVPDVFPSVAGIHSFESVSPPQSIQQEPSTISRDGWIAGTPGFGSTVLTTQAYSMSHPSSPSSTTPSVPTAGTTAPSVVTPGSCQ